MRSKGLRSISYLCSITLTFHICAANNLSRQNPLRLKELTLHVNQTKDVDQCQQGAGTLYLVIHLFLPTLPNFSSIRSTQILAVGLERGTEEYGFHQSSFPSQGHGTRIQPPHQPDASFFVKGITQNVMIPQSYGIRECNFSKVRFSFLSRKLCANVM